MRNIKNLISSDKNFALLHTGKFVPYSDKNSFLLSDENDLVRGSDLDVLEKKIKNSRGKYLFGWLGYGLKNKLEKLPEDKDFFIKNDDVNFSEFSQKENYEPGELQKILSEYSAGNYKKPEVKYVRSDMSKAEYLDKIKTIRGRIERGDVYQANLTRKFYGEFEGDVNAFALFAKLSVLSPAPYSVFYKVGETYIISSSPELFLKVDGEGNAVTCPIKGSARAGAQGELSVSGKDQSENLMITDLMRNDLARACEAGSVKVRGLFETSSFKNISHMHSTIVGKLKEGNTSFDLIKAIFPPGSMTGAPKIQAMKLCSELEGIKRGIYSGILGLINEDICQFSVVIRTIIIQGNKFEFQVGGGIVYDSSPESEWQETMIKASAMAEVLGVSKEIELL